MEPVWAGRRARASLVVQRSSTQPGLCAAEFLRSAHPRRLERRRADRLQQLGQDSHGGYDIAAAEFDDSVRDASAEPGDQGYLLIFSAGNAGPAPGTIGSPAVAKNIIAVGASQSDRSDYSTYRRDAMPWQTFRAAARAKTAG